MGVRSGPAPDPSHAGPAPATVRRGPDQARGGLAFRRRARPALLVVAVAAILAVLPVGAASPHGAHVGGAPRGPNGAPSSVVGHPVPGRPAGRSVPLTGPAVLGTWDDLSANVSSPPSGRQSFVMVYDPLIPAIVLFGGQDGSGDALGDTWEFVHGDWTELSLTTHPSARWGVAGAYDPQEQGVVVFGGRDQLGHYFTDTWLFTSAGWKNITPSSSPSARNLDNGIAYDSEDGFLILHGGFDQTTGTQLTDTWRFENGSWSSVSTNTPPPTGPTHLADDPADGYVLDFVGAGSNCVGTGVTWTYRAGTWSNVTSAAGHPDDDTGAGAFGFDPIERGVMMWSGYSSSCIVTGGTWLFQGGSWYNISGSLPTQPIPRWEGQLAFDPVLGGDIVWGGNENHVGGSNTLGTDTWEFDDGLTVNASESTASGNSPLEDNFTVSGPYGGVSPYSFNWSYGDGSPNGTTANASHTFVYGGSYSIAVKVSDVQGRFGLGLLALRVRGPIGTTPSVTPTLGAAPLPVAFHVTTVGGSSSLTFHWTFGDGNSSSLQNVSHTFTAQGNYTWNLSVSDSYGDAGWGAGTVEVVPTLSARLAATAVDGESPLTVNFTGNVSGGLAPYVYRWSFGDGTTGPNASSCSHTFSTHGAYTVWFNVTDALGSLKTAKLTVDVVPPLEAGGYATPVVGITPLTVEFSATPSAGEPPYSLLWTFGDGSGSSTQTNVAHQYTLAGNYTANLTVTDAFGDVVVQPFAVLVAGPLIAGFSATPTQATTPAKVTFAADWSGGIAPYSFEWSFGDGSSSTAGATVNHTYTLAKNYSVELVVADTAGHTVYRNGSVDVATALIASLAANVSSAQVGDAVAFTASAGGGFPGYTYLWTGLPTGCGASSGSAIHCAPSAAGTFPIAVEVKDSIGDTANATLSFTVNPVSVPPTSPAGSSGVPIVDLEVGLLAAAIVAAVAIAVLVMRRRTPPAPPAERGWEDPPAEQPP